VRCQPGAASHCYAAEPQCDWREAAIVAVTPVRRYMANRLSHPCTFAITAGTVGVPDIIPNVNTSACPQCNAEMVKVEGYPVWCEACRWNFREPVVIRQSLSSNIYRKLGKKWGNALLDEMKCAPVLHPKWTVSLCLAYVMAALIHGFTLFFAVLGVMMIVLPWHNGVTIVVGLLFLMLAWFLRPHPDRFPEHFVSRQQCPGLYEAADIVAHALGAPAPEAIVFIKSINAAFALTGWNRKPVLYLGVPLVSVLDREEFTALLAHELAHAVNGDASRRFMLGTALASLSRWYQILSPKRLVGPGYSTHTFAEVAGTAIMQVFAASVYFIAAILGHLLWRNSQRAEYLADHKAAWVAGTTPVVTLFNRLYLGEVLSIAVRKAARAYDSHQFVDVFAEFKQRVIAMPESEQRRINLLLRQTTSRLDATHPPTAHRIAVLEAHPVSSPSVRLTPDLWSRIQTDLAAIYSPTQKRLIDSYINRQFA
jgi:Zn-dependent protease with chaperone function